MAIKLSELGFIISAQNQLSGVLQTIEGQMKAVNAAAENAAPLKKFGETMAAAGGVAAAAGAAIALPLKAGVEAADQLEDHMARLATAIGNVPDKAAQIAQAHKFVADQAIATGYDVNQLTESLYQGLSGFLDMQQPMAAASEAAKIARGTTGDLADTTSALTTMMLNFGDATKTPIQHATILADKMAALQTQFKFTNLSDLTHAMKEAAPAAMGMGTSLDQMMASLATLSAGGLTGATAGENFRETVTQLSKASGAFEIFAGANGQGTDFLKTLQGIKDRFGDISKNKELPAAFEHAFGARAGSRSAIMLQHLDKAQDALKGVQNSAGRAGQEFEERGSLGFEKLHQAISAIEISIRQALLPTLEPTTQAFKLGVNLLKTFAKGIESAALWPVHAIEGVVTKLRPYPPFPPAKTGPLRDLDRVRIVETIAEAIKPAPLLAAIRRVTMASAIAAPMMIGTATMPAIAARSSAASAAPTVVYAPQVTVHAIGGDAATVEKAVLEALRKHKDEVVRILDHVYERRNRTKF